MVYSRQSILFISTVLLLASSPYHDVNVTSFSFVGVRTRISFLSRNGNDNDVSTNTQLAIASSSIPDESTPFEESADALFIFLYSQLAEATMNEVEVASAASFVSPVPGEEMVQTTATAFTQLNDLSDTASASSSVESSVSPTAQTMASTIQSFPQEFSFNNLTSQFFEASAATPNDPGGFGSFPTGTGSYLDSLSIKPDTVKNFATSATDLYLTSLSQLIAFADHDASLSSSMKDSTTSFVEPSPEEFLNKISKFNEAATTVENIIQAEVPATAVTSAIETTAPQEPITNLFTQGIVEAVDMPMPPVQVEESVQPIVSSMESSSSTVSPEEPVMNIVSEFFTKATDVPSSSVESVTSSTVSTVSQFFTETMDVPPVPSVVEETVQAMTAYMDPLSFSSPKEVVTTNLPTQQLAEASSSSIPNDVLPTEESVQALASSMESSSTSVSPEEVVTNILPTQVVAEVSSSIPNDVMPVADSLQAVASSVSPEEPVTNMFTDFFTKTSNFVEESVQAVVSSMEASAAVLPEEVVATNLPAQAAEASSSITNNAFPVEESLQGFVSSMEASVVSPEEVAATNLPTQLAEASTSMPNDALPSEESLRALEAFVESQVSTSMPYDSFTTSSTSSTTSSFFDTQLSSLNYDEAAANAAVSTTEKFIETQQSVPVGDVTSMASDATNNQVSGLSINGAIEENAMPSVMETEVKPEEFVNTLSSQLSDATSPIASPAGATTATTGEGSDLFSQLSGMSYDSLMSNDQVQSASTAATQGSDLSSQLSGMSYDSFTSASNEVKEATVRTTKKLFGQPHQPSFSHIASDAKSSFGSVTTGITDKFASVKDAGSAQFGKLFGQAGESMNSYSFPKAFENGKSAVISARGASTPAIRDLQNDLQHINVVNSMNGAVDAKKSSIINSVTSAIDAEKIYIAKTTDRISKMTMNELGDSVVGGMKSIGDLLGKVLHTVVENTDTGVKVAKLVATTQTNVSTMIENSIHSAMATINDIGNITVAQAVQTLIGLLVAVVRIMYMVLNAVVKLVTGNTAQGWAVAATTAVQDETGRLLAKAAATTNDITHTSLRELSITVGQFSHDVGQQVVASVSVLGDTSQSIATTIF